MLLPVVLAPFIEKKKKLFVSFFTWIGNLEEKQFTGNEGFIFEPKILGS